jgi:cbb3-type cytochrome oxidase subunit 3
LAETSRSSYNTNSKGSAFGDFLFGIIFIAISFPVLWNNERKQVKIAALLDKGKKECKEV